VIIAFCIVLLLKCFVEIIILSHDFRIGKRFKTLFIYSFRSCSIAKTAEKIIVKTELSILIEAICVIKKLKIL